MASTALAEASQARVQRLAESELDRRLDLLLAHVSHENPGDHYHAVTANPRSMGYLRFLMRYYAKFPHPWTKCFTADTPVDCPRDHERFPEGVPISQLRVGQHVWSYNVAEECFEAKPITWVGITRRNAALLRISLDNGKSVRCTPDHTFLKRDGQWIEARELQVGDSLMPLYRDFSPRIKVRPNAIGSWRDEHQVVVDDVYGDERLGLAAHHVDERYRNTSPENFELLTGAEHRRRHTATVQERFDMVGHTWKCADCGADYQPRNGAQRYCDSCRAEKRSFLQKPFKCEDCGVAFTRTKAHQRYCPACQDARTELKVKGHRLVCIRCGVGFVANSTNHKFCSVSCRDASRDMEKKKIKRGSLGKWVECKQCGESFIRATANARYCDSCRAERAEKEKIARVCRNCGEAFVVTTNQKYCSVECRESYKPVLAGERGWNHKVTAVEEISEREDVWDIEVADNHTLVVHGVVAHNCYADNFKRFGPKTKGLCGVLKDTIRGTAMWRHGAPRGPHPGHPDAGAPGVAIGEADKWAAPAWGGHHHLSERPLSLLDELDMEFGVVDHTEPVSEALRILCALGERCDVYRVLIGLDEPPRIDLSEVLA